MDLDGKGNWPFQSGSTQPLTYLASGHERQGGGNILKLGCGRAGLYMEPFSPSLSVPPPPSHLWGAHWWPWRIFGC